MKPPTLITNDMALAASLRHWGKDEAHRLALAVVWSRYGEDDARAELATFLAWQAEKAGIRTVSCRLLAASMLADQLKALDAAMDLILWEIVDAMRLMLDENPQDFHGAASAGAAVARDRQAPPSLISAGMRIATRGR